MTAQPLVAAALTLCAASATLAQPPQSRLPARSQPPAPAAVGQSPYHAVDGTPFASVADYRASRLFPRVPLRCATPPPPLGPADDPADCGSSSTNPLPMYEPTYVLDIPVAFHVIRDNSGTQGNVPLSQVQNQIDILNEDFLALMGTPGQNGTDCRVRFHLATEDPVGNPTSGVTISNNTTWFNDQGSYWNSLAWDPQRYLNIYSNRASGALGYVPFFPQSGLAGTTSDRVVVLWSTVGRNAPIGFPYDQGRSATHEVGHYVGLYHTFQGGCGSAAACYVSGDLICDTEPESAPEWSCSVGSSSCGSPDPIHNYLNYSYDTCMQEFTPEQARRMRCTIESYRPDLATVSGGGIGSTYCGALPTSIGLPAELSASGSNEAALNDLVLHATELPPNQFGYLLTSQTQGLTANPGGSAGNLCLGGNIGRFNGLVMYSGPSGAFDTPVDLTFIPVNPPVAVQPGETWSYQVWFRDVVAGFSTSNFTNGYEITFL